MSYTIKDYSNNKIGTNGVTVDDRTINTETLLNLVGKGNINYSNTIFENFIYLLSNFSGPFPPGSNFAENYSDSNDWVPTITASSSTQLTQLRTNIKGTFWFQTPELNICSNFISKLISGYNTDNSDDLKSLITSSYDPGNFFTNNPNSVYGQTVGTSGTLWVYTGESTSSSVSPTITTIDGNLYATYDSSSLGWEPYSSVTISKTSPSNKYALWLNTNDNNFYYYDNSVLMWARIGTPSIIEPTTDNTGLTTIADGTFWFKDGQLWAKKTELTNATTSYPPDYQNTTDSATVSDGWVLIGPTSPTPENQVSTTTNGNNGTDVRYGVLIDDSNTQHDNLLIFDSGLLIAIISSDEFTVNSTTPILGNDPLNPTITGFKVYPGINLIGDTYFNGQIMDNGVEYATKQYVDQTLSGTGGGSSYTPVQQGGGTGMATTHIYLGQSSSDGSIILQAGSQQFGSIAFQSWVNSNYLSLATGGQVNGAVSLNKGGTTLTTITTDNSTNIASTAFVHNLLSSGYLSKEGDTATGKINFNGGATVVTVSTTDNSTNVANTAYVNNVLAGYVPTTTSTNQNKCTNLVFDTTENLPYFTSSTWSGYLLTQGTSLSYLPTGDNSNGASLINSTLDPTYNLPSFEDSNKVWHVVPDITYLLNNFSGYIKKAGDNATGKINFNGGATVPTVALTDNSTNVPSTAFVQNNLNKKLNSLPNDDQDRYLTNFIKSYNWTSNGSAGLGCWDQDGTLYNIADVSYVVSHFVADTGGTMTGTLNLEENLTINTPKYNDSYYCNIFINTAGQLEFDINEMGTLNTVAWFKLGLDGNIYTNTHNNTPLRSSLLTSNIMETKIEENNSVNIAKEDYSWIKEQMLYAYTMDETFTDEMKSYVREIKNIIDNNLNDSEIPSKPVNIFKKD